MSMICHWLIAPTRRRVACQAVLAALCFDCVAAAALQAAEQSAGVLLVDQTAKAIEFGLSPDPNQIFRDTGPGKLDPRCGGAFWKDARKIVKTVIADQTLPEGQSYRTALHTDCFAVEGEFVTGVGLWSRSRLMYHWLEYDVPKGARRFTGKLLISDDPTNGEHPALNQHFTFTITVDGKQLTEVSKLRPGQVAGSGEKLADLDVAIPEGAKSIRFRLESTPWGDGNLNTELIVNDGVFSREGTK